MKEWWKKMMRWGMKKREIGYYLADSRDIRKERFQLEAGDLPKSKSVKTERSDLWSLRSRSKNDESWKQRTDDAVTDSVANERRTAADLNRRSWCIEAIGRGVADDRTSLAEKRRRQLNDWCDRTRRKTGAEGSKED